MHSLRDITFDLSGLCWTPSVLTQLGGVLTEPPDAFSMDPTDFDSCSLLPHKISDPPNNSLVASCPCRSNSPTAVQVEAILDTFLEVGLIQYSTSPWVIPVVVMSKKSGGIQSSASFKKLRKLGILVQLPIPYVFFETIDKLQ